MLADGICYTRAMRQEGLRVFREQVVPQLKHRNLGKIKVMILGGSMQDPEIDLLMRNFMVLEVNFLGIDSTNIGECDFQYLDFNHLSTKVREYDVDVAICTGVVEHLWNLDAMFKNFYAIIPNSALLWVSFPVSQFPHGSPEWYSAGYNPTMISKLANLNGFNCLRSGQFGNRRNYLFRHLLHLWPEKGDGVWFAFRWPLISYLPIAGNLGKKFIYQFKTIPHRLILQFSSKSTVHDMMTATGGWVLLERR